MRVVIDRDARGKIDLLRQVEAAALLGVVLRQEVARRLEGIVGVDPKRQRIIPLAQGGETGSRPGE